MIGLVESCGDICTLSDIEGVQHHYRSRPASTEILIFRLVWQPVPLNRMRLPPLLG